MRAELSASQSCSRPSEKSCGGQEGWNPSDHQGSLRTNGGGVVPRDDKRSARDGRGSQWPRRDLLEVSRSMSLDRGSIRDRRHQQNHDMKRLLLLLVPLVLADPAIAFDGGWYEKEEKPELSTDQSETLGNVFRVSPILHGHPNDHVGRGCRTNGRSGYSTLLLRIHQA